MDKKDLSERDICTGLYPKKPPEGANEVRKIATHLKMNNIKIQNIDHSGKLRAYQTVLIFSEILAIENIFELKGMKPNDLPQELIKQISEDATMYIGHLPNIEKVVSKLISNDENLKVIKFQNSAVTCIEIDGDEAYVKWSVLPELCL